MPGTYISPAETGLYYLNTRYYDPETCRFVNADGYITTGQGLLSYNMFAYCLNNPVNYSDSSGREPEWVLEGLSNINSGMASFARACEGYPIDNYFLNPDDAAKDFSEKVYSASMYIQHEYCTEIFSYVVNGTTYYSYNTPHSGEPHSVTPDLYINKSGKTVTSNGCMAVAYAHTHPNSNEFSPKDISYAQIAKINGYVVGPNMDLHKYQLSCVDPFSIGSINPIPLSQQMKSYLVDQFAISWYSHANGNEPNGWDCRDVAWPRS